MKKLLFSLALLSTPSLAQEPSYENTIPLESNVFFSSRCAEENPNASFQFCDLYGGLMHLSFFKFVQKCAAFEKDCSLTYLKSEKERVMNKVKSIVKQ